MAQANSVKKPAGKPVKVAASASADAPAPARKRAASKASSAKAPEVKNAAPVQEKEKSPDPSKGKVKKPKLVRDSFTMPEDEYKVLGEVKKACIKAGFEVKKSELLRVGVALIRKMDMPALQTILATLPPLKAGRPKREK